MAVKRKKMLPFVKIETDSERAGGQLWQGAEGGGVEGLSKTGKKEKELMDTDNSVVIAGSDGLKWKRVWGDKW